MSHCEPNEVLQNTLYKYLCLFSRGIGLLSTAKMIIYFVIIISTIFLYFLYKKPSRFPPGPWKIPILGSLLWLDPQAPYLSLTKFSKKYGPIYSLQLGKLNTVVVSDANMLKKLLIKEECSGRPSLYLLDVVAQGKGVAFIDGELWKNSRKFVSNFFKEIGAGKTSTDRNLVQNIIRKNAEDFVLNVKKETCYSELLVHSTANVLCSIFMGKSYQREDKQWQHFLHGFRQGITMTGVAGPLNFLPFLRFVPPFKKIVSLLRKIRNDLHVKNNKIINENKSSRFAQSFLKKEHFNNHDQVCAILLDLYGAGVDSSTDTLIWIFLYLAEHQSVQNKVREELAVLKDKPFEMEDLSRLPYTEATISEIMRIRTVAPLGIPHYVFKDVEIEGFIIPKGTTIIALLWSINMDPKLWENPEEFRPDRFLNQGRFEKPDYFIPFLTGKRMCPGEVLAKMIIFTFVVTILAKLKILSKNAVKLDLEGVYGLTLGPKVQDLVFENVEKELG